MLFASAYLLCGFFKPQADEFKLSYPMKVDEEAVVKVVYEFSFANRNQTTTTKTRHKCIFVDERGIQTIETEILDGSLQLPDTEEKESLAGETGGYYRNAFGDRFLPEESKPTLAESPLYYLLDQLTVPLSRRTAKNGDQWNEKSPFSQFTVTAGPEMKIDGIKCLKITRMGQFTKLFRGQFKIEAWYRPNGIQQSESIKAVQLSMEGNVPLDFESTTNLISFTPVDIWKDKNND